MASKQEIRVARLKDLLAHQDRIHLRDVAAALNVSEMTVRRDVDAHENALIILGGYVFLAPSRSGYRLAAEGSAVTKAKVAAARNAAARLVPNSTVFIDSGTTLLHLASAMPPGMKLTIVTTSLNVATRVSDNENLRLVLMGGLYHPASDCFISGSGSETPQDLGINQAFFSAGGYDSERGASCYQFHEAQIKRTVLRQSKQNYLVLDSSKIGLLQPVIFAQPAAFDAIITESGDA